MNKLYIAYGSNLNLEQMSYRCPSAEVYGIGVLKNWELIYRGSKTGAYASIRRKKGKSVPVVVWKIEREDEENLDIYEGYPTFYFKKTITVYLQNKKKKGMVYIMDTSRVHGKPSKLYISTIRQGYWDNNLNTNYLERSLLLNLKETKEDAQPIL